MDYTQEILDLMDYILRSKTKRHIVGGVLLSISFMFGGLAVTVMTLKEDKYEE